MGRWVMAESEDMHVQSTFSGLRAEKSSAAGRLSQGRPGLLKFETREPERPHTVVFSPWDSCIPAHLKA
eukprot:scaffold178123_cov21-Tisochrysis_lutea.AAC.1